MTPPAQGPAEPSGPSGQALPRLSGRPEEPIHPRAVPCGPRFAQAGPVLCRSRSSIGGRAPGRRPPVPGEPAAGRMRPGCPPSLRLQPPPPQAFLRLSAPPRPVAATSRTAGKPPRRGSPQAPGATVSAPARGPGTSAHVLSHKCQREQAPGCPGWRTAALPLAMSRAMARRAHPGSSACRELVAGCHRTLCTETRLSVDLRPMLRGAAGLVRGLPGLPTAFSRHDSWLRALARRLDHRTCNDTVCRTRSPGGDDRQRAGASVSTRRKEQQQHGAKLALGSSPSKHAGNHRRRCSCRLGRGLGCHSQARHRDSCR